MKLIVGLGNPGKQYEHTRHNIGFRILDALQKNLKTSDWITSEKFESLMSEENIHSSKQASYKLLKPQTFMNLSGNAVGKILRYYHLDPEKDLLIVSDDKDMVFGKLRFRTEGSSGGHKGLDSIFQALGTEKIQRLKFGIGQGNADQKIPTDAFVLQKFSNEEEDGLPTLIAAAVKEILKVLNPL